MNISKFEDRIRSVIENAIWEYEWREGEKVKNVKFFVRGSVWLDQKRSIDVDVYEIEVEDEQDETI